MRKNSVIFILVIWIGFLLSCNTSAIERIRTAIKVIPEKGLVAEIPERITSPAIGFDIHKRWRESLKLFPLEHGIDGFECRIWEELGVSRGRVTVINFQNNIWTASKCDYDLIVTESSWPDSLSGKFVELGVPKPGWDIFIKKLLDLDILKLKDYDSIPGYALATDEKLLFIEIASNDYYKIYELPGAGRRMNRITDARKILEIVSYVNNSFPGK